MMGFVLRARQTRALAAFAVLTSMLVLGPATVAVAATPVFINEIHYDNTGTDAGEAIEIAGPAGTDLSGWSLVLYNGNGGAVYNTINLSGTIADQLNGYGVLDFATVGIQNGAPDGVALVDAGSVVVQFLSYEGSFTAVGGAADGLVSTDIGVLEDGTGPVGESLQLTGSGTTDEDFTWAASQPNTFGAPNTGQTFEGTSSGPTVFVSEFHYDNAGTDADEFIEVTGDAGADLSGWSLVLYNGNGGALYNTINLSGTIDNESGGLGAVDFATPGLQNGAPDGFALVDPNGDVVEFLSYEGTFTAVDGAAAGMLSTDVGVDQEGGAPVGETLQLINGTWTGPLPHSRGDLNTPPAPTVFISELHYDNDGGDVGEFVEVQGDAGTDLTGWSVVLYNGNGGASYDTIPLSGVIDDESNGEGAVDFAAPGMQNGSPDGLALVDPSSTVIEFLSYEGAFTATDGPANGLTSVDIGVSEPGDTAVGLSLQLIGGVWTGPSPQSPGILNIEIIPTLSCTDETIVFTPIHDIQGNGTSTPLAGVEVFVEGVVVGDFQADDGDATDLAGFYVQEEDADADADPATSEGIFVFDLGSPTDVAEGDIVRLRGNAGEFQDQTQVNVTSGEVVVCSSGNSVTATELPFPLPNGQSDLEAYEGMAVTVTQPMTVIEYFNLDRAGLVDVATERLEQPTDAAEPGPASDAIAAYNDARRIQLDDGSQTQNPYPVTLPDGQLEYADAFGGGDTLADIEGVLSFIRPWTSATADTYAIQLTALPTFTDSNPRSATPPAVGGSLEVAGFNVLNYFNGDGLGGGFPTSRGADDANELQNQTDKIVSALSAFDADVVGLIEIENDFADGANSAIADLVDALNAEVGAGTYSYIDPGANVGADEITVAIIYKPGSVTPVGGVAILDDASFVDPLNSGTDRNRPAMAQTFEEVATGEQFTAVVNHLKSKGSACGDGDDDPRQGNCNATRAAAAQVLVDWLATSPTGSEDPDVILLGDYNSYAMEDPIDVLEAAGYVDLFEVFQPDDVYSYVFDGQTGYLDYGLASESLLSQVTGAASWNINSDEPDAFDYNEDFDNVDNLPLWYAPTMFRSSDHDPVLVGLGLQPPPPMCNGLEATITGSGLIFGTSGADVILGSDVGDVIFGLGGNDTICGGGGEDLIFGGSGGDTILGEDGADIAYAGLGDDTVDAGAGSDLVFGSVGADTVDGGSGNDTIYGNAGSDSLSGGDDGDVIYGGSGADELAGDDGDDSLFGGGGNDALDGGDGDDYGDGGGGRRDSCVNVETAVRCEL